MNFLKLYFYPLILLLISGCAQLTHFNDVETIDANTAIMMDAKQRGVYYWQRKKGSEILSGFCAEPSPDAVSAMAATLGLDLSVTDKGKLGVSQSISEGVANIGIRTAAIQALRDIMYRNCEAFAMGGITEYGLETLQRRFQSTMVAILAIEQLTGAVRSAPTIIVSEASFGSPEAIIDITKSTETARLAYEEAKTLEGEQKEKVDTKSKDLIESESALTDFNSEITQIKNKKEEDHTAAEKDKLTNEDTKRKELTDSIASLKESKEELEKELASLSKSTKEKQQAYDVLESARFAAVTGGGKSSTTAEVTPQQPNNTLDKESITQLASAVKEIVQSTTNLSYYTEVCTTIIGQNANETPKKNSPLEMCKNLLAAADNKELQKSLLEGSLVDSFPGGSDWPTGEISKNEIKIIQKLLNKEGFTEALKVDGVIGNDTKEAIDNVKETCDVKMQKPFPELVASNLDEIIRYITTCKL
ncbi:hypothetical protein JEU11_07630 [Paraglaciecola chathamensis]|uniref:Peptidoglycan binding-like domain-containing protein n=1 Tax=Paraglaciecola chathamensis TaxID=368405 RepID=A0ABS0WCW1_9ALTE|nr:peptidoglycan-binding domain-containing protein [Paraglaciecola chathamensis]MBJ2136315.1 hypothetical protein [Paraglaciecola chathamensis]